MNLRKTSLYQMPIDNQVHSNNYFIREASPRFKNHVQIKIFLKNVKIPRNIYFLTNILPSLIVTLNKY